MLRPEPGSGVTAYQSLRSRCCPHPLSAHSASIHVLPPLHCQHAISGFVK